MDRPDGEDDDNPPLRSRRHLQGYSLNQKLDYIETYLLEHAFGMDHARTPRTFAEHHHIHPRTFSRWLQERDELQELHERSTQEQRRRRRRRLHGHDEQGMFNFSPYS